MKSIISFLLLFLSLNATAQVKLNCCGIKQDIPVFKDDTAAFEMERGYSALITKKVIPSITKSNAEAEIRFIVYDTDMGANIGVISFYNDHVTIKKYQTVVRMAGAPFVVHGPIKQGAITIPAEDERKYYKGYKDIGVEHPGNQLTNLVSTTDLSRKYKTYNWQSFFKQLVDNRFFDLPDDRDFIDEVVKETHPNNYPEGFDMPVSVIQVKRGNHFRNIRYSGGYYPEEATRNLAIVKQQGAFMNLIWGLFADK